MSRPRIHDCVGAYEGPLGPVYSDDIREFYLGTDEQPSAATVERSFGPVQFLSCYEETTGAEGKKVPTGNFKIKFETMGGAFSLLYGAKIELKPDTDYFIAYDLKHEFLTRKLFGEKTMATFCYQPRHLLGFVESPQQSKNLKNAPAPKLG